MEDLFNRKYPNSPGFKKPGTSSAAARSMKAESPTLQWRILNLFNSVAEMTADEAATALGATPFGIRPRFTELVAFGLLEETGKVRKNRSGRFASVYRKKSNAKT